MNLAQKIKWACLKASINIYKLTMDASYPKDPNPENWRTISGAHVHLENGRINGGAGGKFSGNNWVGKEMHASDPRAQEGNLFGQYGWSVGKSKTEREEEENKKKLKTELNEYHSMMLTGQRENAEWQAYEVYEAARKLDPKSKEYKEAIKAIGWSDDDVKEIEEANKREEAIEAERFEKNKAAWESNMAANKKAAKKNDLSDTDKIAIENFAKRIELSSGYEDILHSVERLFPYATAAEQSLITKAFQTYNEIKDLTGREEKSVLEDAKKIMESAYLRHKKDFNNNNSSKKEGKTKEASNEKVTKTEKIYYFNDGRGTKTKKPRKAIVYTKGEHSFIFPKDLNKKKQTMTPEIAMRTWDRVPDEIKAHAPKEIQFVDYYNPRDKYWREKYGKDKFNRSYATGGTTITFYRCDSPHDEDYVVETYCHETGHKIDIDNGRISESKEWSDAILKDEKISGNKMVSTYAEAHVHEDFAVSIAKYSLNPSKFERQYPNRTKIIKRVIKKGEEKNGT